MKKRGVIKSILVWKTNLDWQLILPGEKVFQKNCGNCVAPLSVEFSTPFYFYKSGIEVFVMSVN